MATSPILVTLRPGEPPTVHLAADSVDQLLQLLDQLTEHGLAHLFTPPTPPEPQPTPPASSPAPTPAPSAPPTPLRQRLAAEPMPTDPPNCPDHGQPMLWSKWDYWYCAARDYQECSGQDEWCRWRWDQCGLRQPEPRAGRGRGRSA